jgi:transposase InsO family protein
MALTTDQIDALTPGQSVRCAVAVEPTNAGARKTIERLMRRDPDNERGLRRAQDLRRKRMHSYIRGNRLYYSREKAARVVQPRLGHEWSMTFTPELAADLASVSRFVDFKTS